MIKFYSDKASHGNKIELDDGRNVRLFWLEFKEGTRQQSIYVTQMQETPTFQTAMTAASWQADKVAMLCHV
jgi:hypothetical protein